MDYTPTNLSIKAWAEEDRPREKFLLKGKQNLSDAELLAILLGSGSKEDTAVSLAQKILQSVNNDLNELGKRTIPTLIEGFNGVGQAKAITIAAAMELGRRRQMTDIKVKPKVISSQDAYHIIAPILMDLPHEEFWILLLNRGNKVIAKEQISSGGTTGTVVDAKVLFRKVLSHPSITSIILSHNHPSGNLFPSEADKELTKKLKTAGKTLDIDVLDHLIIGEKGYYSFADEGIL